MAVAGPGAARASCSAGSPGVSRGTATPARVSSPAASGPASFPRLASAPLTNAPAAPSTVLFGILEPGPGARRGPESGVEDAFGVAAIVGLDGVARARTTFTPRSLPVVGNAAPWLGVPPQVAGRSLYFADGAGTIHRLTPEGAVTTVATIATGAQQLLTFAISPDEGRVAATRVTFPPVNPHATGISDLFLPGELTVEMFLFDAGSAPVKVRQAGGAGAAAAVVGWDAAGPLVAVKASFGAQQSTAGNRYFGSPVAHLRADGTTDGALGPAECWTFGVSVRGTIACGGSPGGDPAVYTSDGRLDWTPACGSPAAYCFPQGPALSPSGDKLVTNRGVFARDNSYSAPLPSECEFDGWLGEGAGVCRWWNTGDLSYVTFGGGTAVTPLGFSGVFAGALAS